MRIRLASLCLMVYPLSGADAQNTRTWELGVDGRIRYTLSQPHQVFIVMPIQQVRFGALISDRVSLETAAALGHTNGGGSNFTNLSIGESLLYRLSGTRAETGLYVRPFVEYSRLSGTINNFPAFSSSGSVGTGLGVRQAIHEAISVRSELAYAAASSGSSISAHIGLSFFVR